MLDNKKATIDTTVVNRRQHPHLCLFGKMHLTTAMKLLILIGLLFIAALCTVEAIYLRRALVVMVLPLAVSICTTVALCRRDSRLLWPIIGISFFHLFLDGYATLVFMFFFFVKPLYIIMVLNWAFDTLHTTKTVSFYVYCGIVFSVLFIFFAFNLWQLRTALRHQTYLEELCSSSSASGSSSTDTSSTDTANGNAKSAAASAAINGIGGTPKMEHRQQQNDVPQPQQQQCKLLNKPPIVLLDSNNCSNGGGAAAAGGARGDGSGRRAQQHCVSPGTQRSAHSVQLLRVQQPPPAPMLNGQFAQRRPSLGEHRHFGTMAGRN